MLIKQLWDKTTEIGLAKTRDATKTLHVSQISLSTQTQSSFSSKDVRSDNRI